MKTLKCFGFIITLSLIIITPFLAHADDLSDEETTPDQTYVNQVASQSAQDIIYPGELKVVGRGIQDPKTKKIIAMACVGPAMSNGEASCRAIQNVILSPYSYAVERVGPITVVSNHTGDLSEPSKRELKRTIKAIYKEFKDYKHNAPETVAKRDSSALAIYAGLIPTAALSAVVKGAGLYVGVGAMALLLAWCVLDGHHALITHSGKISKVMIDQNGWNWKESPKKTSSTQFNWYERYLRSFNSTGINL